MEIALAVLSMLAIIVPLIVKSYYAKKLDGEKARRVLLDRDLQSLRADLAKLHPGPPPPPVP